MMPAVALVGTVALHACRHARDYYCATIARPLDPNGRVPGTIRVAFLWLPHAERTVASHGVIVAAEGGPGYPSGASRDGYAALLGPLLRTHDLLLMDDRGTGASGAIDCPPLQTAPVMILSNVTRCGRTLGPTSDLYGSDLAADDLDAILGALGVGSVDLYGDSYGTFFVQVFAARHPGRVRSVTLDGAYPAIGGDAWYASTGPTIRRAFDIACRRSPPCATLAGDSMSRIDRLLRLLRKPNAPISPSALAFVMDSAGLDALAYRDLDAAARAYVAGGDAAPLRRLAAEAQQYEEKAPASPSLLSQGLFVAASCSDNPQAYDMRLPPAARQQAWQRAREAMRRSNPRLYAPFTLDEFLGIPLDYAYVPLCQTWPVASPDHRAGQPVPPGTGMPRVRALVLTGDLDTITTPAEGDAAAALFPGAERIIVANTGHVTAIGDTYDCASRIVRRFIAGAPLDASCARNVPAEHLTAAFARTLDAVVPARPLPGSRWSARELRVAAAAVDAAGDALARVQVLGLGSGSGLRGGSFRSRTNGDRTIVTLRALKWTGDLPVDGTVTVDGQGRASASLHAAGMSLHARWNVVGAGAAAGVDASLGGAVLRASMPAP